MYSILEAGGKEKRTAKGIVKSVIIKERRHEIYKNIFETSDKMDSKMKVIRAPKHRIYTMGLIKVFCRLTTTRDGLRMMG